MDEEVKPEVVFKEEPESDGFEDFDPENGDSGTNCLKIGLPGKLILIKIKIFWKSYSLENSL